MEVIDLKYARAVFLSRPPMNVVSRLLLVHGCTLREKIFRARSLINGSGVHAGCYEHINRHVIHQI